VVAQADSTLVTLDYARGKTVPFLKSAEKPSRSWRAGPPGQRQMRSTEVNQPGLSRREFAASAAALAAAPAPARAAERYRLGCMAAMFSAVPWTTPWRASARPVTATLRQPQARGRGRVHARNAARRTPRVQRRFKDLGVEPFLSIGGFGSEPTTEKGLTGYLAQLDLCADFGIPIMVGGGPWYYKRFPNLPKRDVEWREEVDRFYAALEKAVRHAESIGVTITLKPHTGITANAKACWRW